MTARRKLVLTALLSATLLGATACGGASTPGPSAAPTGGTPVKGGTATEAVTYAPNYIFPFFDGAHYTGANGILQRMLYRPLYWAPDEHGHMALNKEFSAAEPPQFTNGGKSVVVKLKDWQWSNGEPLQAKNVTFFLNMMKSQKTNFGPYTPGRIPDNITDVKIDNDKQLTITFDRVYAEDWVTLNQLDYITPMPEAWDITGPGKKADCADQVSACAAVYKYLAAQAKSPSTYADSPIWSVVDGPWKITDFKTDGSVSFVPNAKYSGSPKPQLAKLNMNYFSSDTSEYNVLRSGGSVDVGWLPANAAPTKPKDAEVGNNPVSGYTLQPTAFWGAMGLPMNFNNPTVGVLFKQAYIRQALQSTVDQEGYINAFLAGYGTVQTGPVPAQVQTPYRSKVTQNGGPWPFDVDKAKSLLESHGWKIVPNGTSTCVKPGSGADQCGAGIKAGTPLSLKASYVNNPPEVGQQMQQWKSDASKAGISLQITGGPFNTVYGASQPCKPQQAECSWQIVDFTGFGYYSYPVGDLFFSSTAGSNWGHYDDPKADQLINNTLKSSDPSVVQAYDQYLAEQVPMIWFPTPVGVLNEVSDKLRGVIPDTGGGLSVGLKDPEYWYFVK